PFGDRFTGIGVIANELDAHLEDIGRWREENSPKHRHLTLPMQRHRIELRSSHPLELRHACDREVVVEGITLAVLKVDAVRLIQQEGELHPSRLRSERAGISRLKRLARPAVDEVLP